jgi:hypothetical protein
MASKITDMVGNGTITAIVLGRSQARAGREENHGNKERKFGIDIVRDGIQNPLRQIAGIAGEYAAISRKLLDNNNYNYGSDARAGNF